MPQGAGGILGQAIGDGFTVAFSAVGSRLILLAVFLFGMTIFTDLSWLRLMDKLGAWCHCHLYPGSHCGVENP